MTNDLTAKEKEMLFDVMNLSRFLLALKMNVNPPISVEKAMKTLCKILDLPDARFIDLLTMYPQNDEKFFSAFDKFLDSLQNWR